MHVYNAIYQKSSIYHYILLYLPISGISVPISNKNIVEYIAV